MQAGWFSLVPPFVTLACAFLTRHIIFGLLCGIATGALIATNWSVGASIQLVIAKLAHTSGITQLYSWDAFWHNSNLFILLFLVILAIIVTMMSYSGGSYAYSTWAKQFITNAKTAQLSSVALSFGLCIDDYFSSLTVGSVMQPITDHYRVPRIKLAFLVDSFAAPLALICPVSSWIAGIIGFLNDNGVSTAHTASTLISADPFSVYLGILPFIFYPFILIISVLFIILKPISFGLMNEHEQIARRSSNLFGGKPPRSCAIPEAPQHNVETAQLGDFLYPIIALIALTIICLLVSGGYSLFGGTESLIGALQKANAPQALFIAGILALIFSTFFFLARSRFWLKHIPLLYATGAKIMVSTLIMLVCAWTLGDILRVNLMTGQFVASLMPTSTLSTFFIVPLLFLLALAVAFSIGSSWATMAIMLPIAIPMVIAIAHMPVPVNPEQLSLLFIAIGAIFSGAVAGNHISPLADTTVMSASSSGAYLTDHVHAQLMYALPIIIASTIAFFVAPFIASYNLIAASLMSIIVGGCSSIVMLFWCNKASTK